VSARFETALVNLLTTKERKTKVKLSVLFLFVLNVLIPVVAAAQNTKGAIAGTVADQNGAVVAGATITLTDTSRNFSTKVETDTEGAFRFAALEPADKYSVRVEASNFQPLTLANIQIRVGETVNLSAKLTVNSQQATVFVESGAGFDLQIDDTKQSRSFSAVEMNDLPVQASGTGRNFYAQARTAPGVAVSTQAHAPFAVAGSRPRSNNYLLDLVDNTDANTGLIAGRGVTEQFVSQEAVGSFEILTHNFKAEYGRNSGGVVNLVTKSGTNDVRGSLYWYHNNSALSARNFFQNEKPQNLSNLAGFTVGAPLIKDRWWVFGQWETFRLRGTNPSLYQGLTAAEKAVAQSSPIAALANLYPTVSSNANRFLTLGVPSATDQYSYLLRSDWQINSRGRLMFRVSDTKSNREAFGIGNLIDSRAPGIRRTAGATVQHSWNVSPFVVNEFRVGYNRQVEKDDYDRISPLLLGNPIVNGEIGTLRVTGLSTLGVQNFYFGNNFQNNTALSNDLTVIRGAHVAKFGGNLRFIKVNGGNVDNTFRGTLTFNSVAQFLAAQPASYTRNIGNPQLGLRRKEFAVYAQDDWRVLPNLIVNLGLRYEIFTAPRETDDKLNPAYLLKTDYNNLAPRFGFAWNFAEKTVVRGGYGIYYNVVETSFLGLTRFNPPFIQNFTAVNPTFPNLLAQAQTGLPSGLVVPNQNSVTPYAQHLTLGVERELFNPQSTLSISYVGTLSRNLSRTRRPNGGEQLAQSSRPDRSVGIVNVLETSANADYQSLQMSLNTRLSATLQVRAAYTWSKFVDDVSDIANSNTNLARDVVPLDERRLFLDRAPSNYDIPHVLTVTYSYRLPFFRNRSNNLARLLLGDWTISGINTFRSGLPYTIYTGTNTPLGNNNQRPFGIENSFVRTRSDATAIVYANGFTRANLTPTPTTFGTLGRNTERTEPTADWNVSLQKDWRVSERFKAQFRAEVFNLFNTTNFNQVDNVMTSPTFGRYISAFDPRRAQLALRLEF
jgi:hypothetical protein